MTVSVARPAGQTELALGIDLGGTKVLSGVIDPSTGAILSSAKKRSHAEHGPKDLIQRLIKSAHEAIDTGKFKNASITSVGIGVAGQIDRVNGIVIRAPNLAGMQNVPLAKLVERDLKMPVSLYNDVEAAAAGEAAFGAGKGRPDFVVIFVGTGIGGAIYRNGKPVSGATHTAGEIGHTVIAMDGRLCGCGQTGHLEAYASRTAIVKTILGALHAGRSSVLGDLAGEVNPNDPGGTAIRSNAIAEALEVKDAVTQEMVAAGARSLAAGLVSVINFYNPPLVILGGGLIQAVDPFFRMAADRAMNEALAVSSQAVEIVKSGLGDNSGIVGAAVLAASARKKSV